MLCLTSYEYKHYVGSVLYYFSIAIKWRAFRDSHSARQETVRISTPRFTTVHNSPSLLHLTNYTYLVHILTHCFFLTITFHICFNQLHLEYLVVTVLRRAVGEIRVVVGRALAC
jgi:hypothetical protein